MTLTTRLKRTGAMVLTGVLGASCLTLATATTADAAGHPPTTRVWITKYRNVKMPDVIRPGLQRIVVRSAKSSDLQIVKARHGYTKREATRDIRRGLEQGKVRPFKRLERNIELRGGVSSAPGDKGVMFVRLQPGTYWAIDVNGPALARKIETFRVAGHGSYGRLPGAKIIVASGVHEWAPKPAVIPNAGRLRFYNPSAQSHFLEMVKLREGKTLADFEEWMANGFEGAPPVNFNVSMSTGVVDTGRAMSVRYRLPEGNYILICFWPDPNMDMMPHAAMGMYREIRLR